MEFSRAETIIGMIAGTALLVLVGWVVSSFGMPTPEQVLAYEVGQTIKADGIGVDRVSCEPSGDMTKCRVNLTGGGLTSVLIHEYEDGSWRFANSDDRP
jgi:hypothetical protein